MERTPEQLEALKDALRNLKAKGFYEPETDNPEGIPLEDESQTMQADPSNLEKALKGTRREEMLKKILEQAK